MEFGDKQRFAVVFELDSNSGGAWLFGRFCYWIGGEQIGDYEAGVSLRDILFQMTYILGDAGKRLAPKLMALPGDQAFGLISSCLNDTSNEIFSYVSAKCVPARFDVRIPIDVFNEWNIYLLDGVSVAKLLYSHENEGVVRTLNLLPEEFDRVMRGAHSQLDLMLQQEVDKK